MADTTKKASVQIVNEEQENMAVTEVETTEEENKTLIRMNEDDFIKDLSVRLIMRKMIHSASKLPEMERCFSHLKSDRYPKRNTTSARRNIPSM